MLKFSTSHENTLFTVDEQIDRAHARALDDRLPRHLARHGLDSGAFGPIELDHGDDIACLRGRGRVSSKLAAGAGADAVIAPEMLTFARLFNFQFRAHRVGHPDRKGRIERPLCLCREQLPGRS